MNITMLGTGNAMVTECYNTCFVLQDGEKHLLVDGGGGNTLLRQLKKAGFAWQDMREIEAYADSGSAMMLLHLREQAGHTLSFAGLDTLLDALAALPEPAEGQLGFWEGSYILTVSDPGAAAVLSEFGQAVSRCDQYQAEREGALILSETGVKELWGCLHP